MDKIEELLTRGVEKIIPSKEELEKVLRSGKKLRIYQGFDPTSPEFHIGHMVGLRKLRQWQDLGHEVIFLIGDFTGRIGDPTGKDKTRVPLTKAQVLENAKTYKEQAAKILRFEGENAVKIKHNSEWLDKIPAPELIRLTSFLTFQQVIERDMFQRRLSENKDISISEFLYPFMQGYDSVEMDVDVEVGGNDQLFNMMTGRDLMHKIKKKNKFVMTTPLLTDSEGKKIGKTEGNVIALTEKPEILYSQIMALPDDIITKGFEYLTDVPMEEIEEIKKSLKNGENPVASKKKLAFEIVKQLNSEKEAEAAAENFRKIVQDKETPLNIVSIKVEDETTVSDAILKMEFASSKSEVKRLAEQKGITLNGKTIEGIDQKISEGILKVGKKKFVKITKI